MKRTLPLLLLLLLGLSCGNNRNSNYEEPDSRDTENPDLNTTGKVDYQTSNPTYDSVPHGEGGNVSPRKAEEQVRLVVSFISQGEGIDLKTKGTFDTWLKSKGNITHDEQSWGREGEVNYCFTLDNLSPAEQDKFVEEVRAQLVGRNNLVRITENTTCRP